MRLLCAAMLSLSGCASLPHPLAPDVERAKVQWPEANLASLEDGRKTYVNHCSGCHSLYLPGEHRPDEWPKLLDEMAGRAKLNGHDRALIEQFLVVMSDTPRG